MIEILEQKRTRTGQIFPFPRDGENVMETPPCFSWLKCAGHTHYAVEIYRGGSLFWRGETVKNYIIPDLPLPAGSYEWNIISEGAERGKWRFAIDENAVGFERPTSDELLEALSALPESEGHPRIMFTQRDTDGILAAKKDEIAVLRRNISLALSRGKPSRPMYHRDENALPYREYFGEFRDWCDRDLIALSIGWRLLGDREAGLKAKELLLEFCDWNPEGPCSLLSGWGDEVGLSLARCLPTAYDLLYDLLDTKQRDYVRSAVAAYAFQCEKRLISLDFCQNPGNSHSGRIPAYLGEAAIVLAGSGFPSDILKRWLDLALDIYGGIFPYFGGADGGWAEGAFYASSYTKWYLPFFLAVERFTGKSFLCRPFYQRYIHFLAHFIPPGQENHPFGDGYWCAPDDPEWPGFFAQDPYRVYAERYYPEQPEARELMLGWERSFACPEIFKLHLLDIFVPDRKPDYPSVAGNIENLRVFPDSGFVSMHTCISDRQNDVSLLTRASRYGSFSHEHPDHGSFALFKGGTALISPSGYFGRQYGSAHHRLYTNSTAAHNCILVDGEGQQPSSYEAVGKILSAGTREKSGDTLYECVLDTAAAYPMLKRCERKFELCGDCMTVSDFIESDKETEITFLLHSLSRPRAEMNSVVIERGGYMLTVTPLEGGLDNLTISDRFPVDLNEGEPERYHVTMPPQYHIRLTTPRRSVHRLRVSFIIKKLR